MKSFGNQFPIGVALLLTLSLVLSLSNAASIDSLQADLENVMRTPRTPTGVGIDQTILLSELLQLILDSNLQPDSSRFIVDFIHLHLGDLPTVNQINDMIEILKKIEQQTANSGSSIPDFLSKLSKGNPPGPGGSGAGAGVVVN